jgi:hypothetical protein
MEARQAARFGNVIISLEQQEEGLALKINQVTQQRDAATNRLAVLAAEHPVAEPESPSLELLRLRGEASRLEANAAAENDGATNADTDAWLARVNQLKQYVADHPDDAIPEFQYLGTREWLLVVDSSNSVDLAGAMGDLKMQAEGEFAIKVAAALKKYAKANNGQFPENLSDLQPYGDAGMEEILQERYEIKPVSTLDPGITQFANLKGDRIIASKQTLGNGSPNHVAIYPGGYTYFQGPS